MPSYSLEHSCIESINASYKVKVASNKRSRGLDEYQAAQREARGEPRMELRAAVPREQPARRRRQAVPKRPQGSTSTAEPAPKKARKDLEAEASRSEAIPSGVEARREEEEEEDEAPLFVLAGCAARAP